MPDSRLHLRDPALPWALTAVVMSLSLHCLVWIAARMLVQNDLDTALEETRTQIGLALSWLIATLAFWCLFPPKTRVSALMSSLFCVVLLAFLGSLIAYIRVHLSEGFDLNLTNILVFSFYSLLMLLAQVLLAVPALLILQAISLTRGTTIREIQNSNLNPN